MRKQCFLFLFLVYNTFPIPSVGTQSSEETARLINLRLLVDCKDQVYESKNIVHSNFWVLVNYIQASHGDLRCSTNVTYTTHADYRYLNNVGPLVERWRSPISLALYAPGLDFMDTVKSILWLRQCDSQQKLIKELVSFHIYFDLNEIPKKIPKARSLLKLKINCRELPPFEKFPKRDLYRLSKGLEYPVNVGRNIAINAALTHFVLASDIELYPSPGLAQGFLQMLDNNRTLLKSETRIVYPLKIFEVQQTSAVPSTKYELQNLLAKGSAQSFHLTICPSCHSGPRLSDWINSNNASNNIKVFHVSKWKPYYKYWEPICIGTKNDPHYYERLTWEGMWDKWTQIYTLCLLDYEFHTLDNAFLVHKPGIKRDTVHQERLQKSFRTYKLLMRDIILELVEKYSWHRNCAV